MERQAKEKVVIQDYYRNGVALVNHEAIPGAFQPARELLLKERAPVSIISQAFTPDGKYRALSLQPNPEFMSPFLLAEAIEKGVRPIYELIDYSVNTIYPYGFISHNMSHIERVFARGYSFLTRAMEDNQQIHPQKEDRVMAEKVFVTAALGHDTGNLQGREDQTDLSVAIMQQLFPALTQFPDFFHRVSDVIRLHSNTYLEKVVRSWDYNSADKVIERMSKEFPIELLALFLGDKVDRGRQRVHPKSGTRKAFDSNRHIALNFFGSTSEANFSEDGKNFTWDIAISDVLSSEDAVKFPGIVERADGAEQKAYIPHEIRENIEINGKSFFEVFQEELWKTSSGKLFQTAMIALALSPKLNEFHLRFIDKSSSQEGKFQEHIFRRGEVQKTMDIITARYIQSKE